jgi:hypothetical protein
VPLRPLIQPPLIAESLFLHALSANVPIAQEGQKTMTVRSKLALGLAAGALVIGSVSPAAARGYDGRWRHHRHNDGPSAGAVFGILLGVGVIAAIAASNEKKKREAEQRGYDPRTGDRSYDPQYDERRADSRTYDDRNYDGRRADDRNYDSSRAYASEDEAVDACAVAARYQAASSGGFAEIRGITEVRPYNNGYDVTGTIDQRSSYRANDRRTRSFRCTFDNGRVEGVSFGVAI